MNKDRENIWLASFGPGVPFGSRSESPLQSSTNSLGLPLIKKTPNEVFSKVLQFSEKPEGGANEQEKEINDQMSLLGILKEYNKDNYKLNPVVVQEEDYNTYYGGISNGLLWPAFHNLGEYIVKDYDDPQTVKEHWHAYVRVNYQFALNAVRSSRPQDFIWIHDYHLMLTGMIMQSLDPHIEVGFFLHIPFQPPEDFFAKYSLVAHAVLRGFLRFTKVGFQTHKDRECFLELVSQHLPSAKIVHDAKVNSYMVNHEGWRSSLGVFPVSIKNEEFLSLARDPEVLKEVSLFRESIKKDCLEGGKIFFSVERFDYTKGIKEKLEAYRRFLEQHPDRWGFDVLVQVAVINRRTVETYRQYQDDCMEYVDNINKDFRNPEVPNWRPILFLTEGLPRPKLVSRYLGMDVGVVTPKKDGMNLVAKEMVICNPKATVILSCGAGTEQQLSAAGFYTDALKCYHRVTDVYNIQEYADAFYAAAVQDPTEVEVTSGKLREFLMANDIERWSSAFLDPSWTHDVIRQTELGHLAEFYNLMFQTRNVRRQIVERVLKGIPIRAHFGVSLKNAQESLKAAFVGEKSAKTILLRSTDDPESKPTVTLDVSDEYEELEKDLAFLEMVQSEDFDNVEQFLRHLEQYHPESPEAFHDEKAEVLTLITRGDFFHYFFTDRDGTLKSYSSSYPASIQPSYSGVIQATFAHRCTQYAAILTSAPLMNIGILDVQVMADGYFCYGASTGREWYIEASKKFKDRSIPEADLWLLHEIGDRIQALIDQPQFQHFAWIGSGLQRHFGHITISRQDPFGSVDAKKSLAWLEQIKELTGKVDPEGNKFKVFDNGTDIKIYLKAKEGEIFNKGHGIRLFAEQMSLDLKEGKILVCGDSDSDLPMLEECLKINPEHTYTVWVTRNEELRQKVIRMCGEVNNGNYAFVSCPEVILGAMGMATVREIRLRPTEEASTAPEEDQQNWP
jgi:trehalose 6-phosphate synthase